MSKKRFWSFEEASNDLAALLHAAENDGPQEVLSKDPTEGKRYVVTSDQYIDALASRSYDIRDLIESGFVQRLFLRNARNEPLEGDGLLLVEKISEYILIRDGKIRPYEKKLLDESESYFLNKRWEGLAITSAFKALEVSAYRGDDYKPFIDKDP